jgi:hypothetical protein
MKSTTELVLYDLKTDPVEIHDISGQHPDIVERLKPLLPPVGPYRNLKREAKKDSPRYTQYPCREKKTMLKGQQPPERDFSRRDALWS